MEDNAQDIGVIRLLLCIALGIATGAMIIGYIGLGRIDTANHRIAQLQHQEAGTLMSEPVKTYPSEESAQRCAEQLQALGIWPGVVRHGERWRLTVDPDTAGQRRHTASEAGA